MARCKARKKSCRQCGHRYPKSEYELWNCPDCGEPRQCQRRANTGYEVCQVHGGGSPLKGRIPDPPRKSGRYSKALLGTNYLKAYEESLADPRQIELKHHIAVSHSRYDELLKRTQERDSSKAWEALDGTYTKVETLLAQIKNAYTGFVRAMQSKDNDLTKKRLEELAELLQQEKPITEHRHIIQHGLADWAVWNDREKEAEHYRRLVESERRLYVDSHRMVALDKMLGILRMFLYDIHELIDDPATIKALGFRLQSHLEGHRLDVKDSEWENAVDVITT